MSKYVAACKPRRSSWAASRPSLTTLGELVAYDAYVHLSRTCWLRITPRCILSGMRGSSDVPAINVFEGVNHETMELVRCLSPLPTHAGMVTSPYLA